jgi:hypothetical protein
VRYHWSCRSRRASRHRSRHRRCWSGRRESAQSRSGGRRVSGSCADHVIAGHWQAQATYSETVAEGGALGGGVVDRSGQAAGQASLGGLDGADGLLGAEAVVKAHREPARCHGHCERRRAGWGGWASRVESSGPARCERPPANDRAAIRTELLLGCLPGFVRLRPPYRLERALCIAL